MEEHTLKIGIVILNYLNWHDTVECIDSLANQTSKNYEIVVVDNQSKNESFDELYHRYGEIENIHLLQSTENLGFAKGNNIGINYCKKVLELENILVINNDVIFTDPNYIEYLSAFPIGKNIGVVGSTIIGSDGKNQNPSAHFKPGFKAVFREYTFPLLRKYKLSGILKLGSFVKNGFKKAPAQPSTGEKKAIQKPYNLHGSALFLTENYVSQIDGLYPGTFLYYEEEILALVCHKLGLEMVYTDEIEIYHKEDQSSKMSFNNESTVKYKMGRKSVRTGLKVSLMDIKKIQTYTNTYPYQFMLKKQGNQTKYEFQ